MDFTKKENLMQYLKKAIELETSVYAQKEQYELASSQIIEPEEVEALKIESKEEMEELLEREKKVLKSLQKVLRIIYIIGIGSVIAGIIMCFVDDAVGWGLIIAPIPLLLFALLQTCTLGVKQKEIDKHTKKISEIDNKNKIKEERYNAEIINYDNGYKKYVDIKTEVDKLLVPLNETESVLKQFYSYNVIYPKYRNLAAVCTIYEYFETGRVNALTGPHGAYNLYESELRQDLIISNLEDIADCLEEIRDTQYMLYSAIEKANSKLDRIYDVVEDMSNDMAVIRNNSVIQAECAKRTAENTAVLKWMEILE